jgi:hypothetical protein
METTPDMEKPRETYRRLAALATNTAATEAERESAERVMARYLARYGSEVEIPEAEPQILRHVTYANKYEDNIAHHCGVFAGCSVRVIGRLVYEGTPREKFRADGKTIRYVGPESAVLSAVELYEHHRTALAELLEVVENGYRFGAMPLPPKEGRTKARVMSPAIADALHAAADFGRASKPVKRLGPA